MLHLIIVRCFLCKLVGFTLRIWVGIVQKKINENIIASMLMCNVISSLNWQDLCMHTVLKSCSLWGRKMILADRIADRSTRRSLYHICYGKVTLMATSRFRSWTQFGEVALLSENCIRQASIISDEPTDLLVVNRELYNRSLHSSQV